MPGAPSSKALTTPEAMTLWVAQAQARAMLPYAEGYSPAAFGEAGNEMLRRLGELGFIYLVQRRLDAGGFHYLAQRSSRPWGKSGGVRR